jgi:adenylate kinase family enzyme
MALTPLLLAFSGGIGSGKSTLSSGVANTLRWPRSSFGDHVRAVALSRGLDADARDVQQEVGALLAASGWAPFCRAVLAQADWRPGQPLVVDGVRHVEALETLRTLVTPTPVALIHVTVGEVAHVERLRGKGIDDLERRRVEAHSTEAQVATVLPAVADMIADGARPKGDLIADIVRWVRDSDATRR